MTSLIWLQNEMISGAQPESIRDYQVIGVDKNGKETVLAKVLDNYQKLRRHSFDPIKVSSIHIQVDQGNGDEVVGIYEIRAYGPS
jgi:hypothetical protein